MVKLKKILDLATWEMHCVAHEMATGTQIRALRYIVASIEEAFHIYSNAQSLEEYLFGKKGNIQSIIRGIQS
jgi:hypothetical protein